MNDIPDHGVGNMEKNSIKATKTNIVEVIQGYLTDLAHLVKDLTESEYITQGGELMSGSVGSHVRHLLAHIQILVDAFFTAQSGEKVVEYDIRERGTELEKKTNVAIDQIKELCQQLQMIHPKMLGSELKVLHSVSARDNQGLLVKSNLERELMFTLHHAIHHFAMISIRMRIMNKEVPEGFGYAPATALSMNS